MNESINQVFLKSNIINEEETKREIKEILNEISEVISKSLGPYGSTTIIQTTVGNEHFMTKDGYTILKHMHFYHDIPKTILEIIRKISKALVRTVGDGSTSAIVIANKLFELISNLSSSKKMCPHDIITILNIYSELLEEQIHNVSIKISEDNLLTEITKIATVSNNNDETTGKLIAEIYSKIGKYGFINLESGDRLEDKYELISGYEVKRGWINQRMVNNRDGITAIVENPQIFMCNDILDDAELEVVSKLIEDACLKSGIPIIIIAANYSSSFKAFFDANLQRKPDLPVYAIDIDCSTSEARKKFEDLAIVLNCGYYNKFERSNEPDWPSRIVLGSCKKAIITDNHSTFIEGKGFSLVETANAIKDRIEDLEKEYETYTKLDYTYDREKQLFSIKKRIASLRQNSTATLYVGGNSEIERQTRKFLIEDSIFACRSALEYGYIVGGNLIVPKLIHNLRNDFIKSIMNDNRIAYLKNQSDFKENLETITTYIYEAFLNSYIQVLKNSYMTSEQITKTIDKCLNENLIFNLKNREFEKDIQTDIINSAETDIEIIKACFSIIGLLATSNQFLMLNAISLKDQR